MFTKMKIVEKVSILGNIWTWSCPSIVKCSNMKKYGTGCLISIGFESYVDRHSDIIGTKGHPYISSPGEYSSPYISMITTE